MDIHESFRQYFEWAKVEYEQDEDEDFIVELREDFRGVGEEDLAIDIIEIDQPVEGVHRARLTLSLVIGLPPESRCETFELLNLVNVHYTEPAYSFDDSMSALTLKTSMLTDVGFSPRMAQMMLLTGRNNLEGVASGIMAVRRGEMTGAQAYTKFVDTD